MSAQSQSDKCPLCGGYDLDCTWEPDPPLNNTVTREELAKEEYPDSPGLHGNQGREAGKLRTAFINGYDAGREAMAEEVKRLREALEKIGKLALPNIEIAFIIEAALAQNASKGEE
jgi:hypothetical protein